MKKLSTLTSIANEAEIYREEFLSLVKSIDLKSIIRVAELLYETSMREGSVFVCGNGGSAALSQHFAIDLGLGTRRFLGAGGCRIFDLSSNAAVLTATSNDLSFEEVFSRQLELVGTKDDVLIVISASGNSRNLVNAVSTAKKLGIITVSLTGFQGGALMELAQYSIHIPSQIGEYGRVEDSHSFVLHLLTHILRELNRMTLQ